MLHAGMKSGRIMSWNSNSHDDSHGFGAIILFVYSTSSVRGLKLSSHFHALLCIGWIEARSIKRSNGAISRFHAHSKVGKSNGKSTIHCSKMLQRYWTEKEKVQCNKVVNRSTWGANHEPWKGEIVLEESAENDSVTLQLGFKSRDSDRVHI